MPEEHIGTTVRRSKKGFKSARAAWSAIARETGLSPSAYVLKRQDTKDFYAWRIVSRRRNSGRMRRSRMGK